MASSEKAPSEILSLAEANNYLAMHLHRLLAEEKVNVFFSPFSISTAMAMVFCAAGGETEAEMSDGLGYEYAGIGKDTLKVAIETQTSQLLGCHDGYTLTSANSMLYQMDFDIKEDYKSILTKSFNSLLMAVDFQNDSASAVKQVNDWVKEKTNGMISTLIESLDRDTIIVLLNAVYFKGSWRERFNKEATSSEEFFNYGKERKMVDMMKMKEEFPYMENDLYQALQLPYVGKNIVMLVLLPRAKDGLPEVESRMSPSVIVALLETMCNTKVKVGLPRFRLEYSKALVPYFRRLGIDHLFGDAQLDGISDSAKLRVSVIFHKAVLEVNEEGSEAAAATMIRMVRCCMIQPPDPEFTVDHPFVFFIIDKRSNLILFMGRIEEL